jgi:hypothetical protein
VAVMARIRSIKPEFWTSEQIMECSPMARLMFIGLWNFCDDAGRHPRSSRQIKAQIFPGDDITAGEIDVLIGELSANGLIDEYSVDGKEYFVVTGWHHQKIDKPQPAKYPPPFEDHSDTGSRMVSTDRIGEERKDNTLSPAKPPERERKKLNGKTPPHRRENDEAWERVRAVYPKRKGDYEWKTARDRFDREIASGTDPEAIIAGAAAYAEQQRELGHIGTPYVKQASRFMSARTWEEFSRPTPADATADDWERRLKYAREHRRWSRPRWGPMPNEPGCLIPPSLIRPDDGTGWAEWGEANG